MGNLYGFVGPIGEAELVLMSLDRNLQARLSDYFLLYEEQFLHGVEEAIAFDGGYAPDEHQVMTLDQTPEMVQLASEISRGMVGRERYDPSTIPPERLRGLAWAPEEQDGRILVQNFNRTQALSRKMAIFFSGETFTTLEEPALVIGDRIDAILERNSIKFKKFSTIKQIFDLSDIYREASDQDIRQFFATGSVHINNIDAFCSIANTTARKLLFSVSRSGILDQVDAIQIREIGQAMDVEISIEGGKVSLPEGRDLVKVLKFLDHSIYRSPLTNDRWMANSRRRIG